MAREAVETSARTTCSVRDRKGEWHMKSSLRPGWIKKNFLCFAKKRGEGEKEEATSKADANENGLDQR